MKNKPALSDDEKERIRSGELKPSSSKRAGYGSMKQDGAIIEFKNKSDGQINSPRRFGGKKLGSHKKKRRANVKGIPRLPPKRKPAHPVENDIECPSDHVKAYLDHLLSIKPNTYSGLLKSCWGCPDISEEGYRILCSLPQTPSYSLRYVMRIFSSDSWQNIPSEDRQFVFEACTVVDFRSLHFEIFRMLVRKHCGGDEEIASLLGSESIWDWFAIHGIDKQDAKMPVQMLINGMSMKKVKRMLREPERQQFLKDKREPPADWVPSRGNALDQKVEDLVKSIYKARENLLSLIKRDEIFDAFDRSLPNLSPSEYFKLKDRWKPFWMMGRMDLNTLYSSYELKLLTDVMTPVIRGYDGFKIVLHLHDGVYFQVEASQSVLVLQKIEKDSRKILKSMDIRTELTLDK